MKLYELPRDAGIKINVEASDGSKYITFHHVDGMYSYCETEKGAVVHLNASAELTKQSDGSYNIADEHKNNKD